MQVFLALGLAFPLFHGFLARLAIGGERAAVDNAE
jgi:hypothetical protein